ncbi:hypothetical protein DICPUDRAFT_148108 [Dictyostelium purpureum]|uniref:RCC1-like domain-containing protein n=1 Tax=Dictyostelium purpureum TaxID=5786 RepID=F0ZA98_DICPU|nr:uncharacterized protein DICPUDRAFT_148108 [Dictyostelium purpureum]EGC39089.1 hypothetical protein DICPUDRAFT_148108 [Dictyostelium purpureum]|eukprot:XP_003284341.1 hypothetical protein DICPUDRAFT_148108 [Dictyostelium purpureum]
MNEIKVFSWGSGNLGQLGLGNTDDSVSSPSLVLLSNNEIRKVNDIVGGGSHTMMVANDGDLYTFGSNDCGQLGFKLLENQKYITTPQPVDYFKNNSIKIKNCSGGWSHSLACDVNGFVYSWGSNSHSQLGLTFNAIDTTEKEKKPQQLPIKIDSNNNNNNNSNTEVKRKIVFKKKIINNINKENQFNPININYFINEKIKIISVSCGMRHSIVLSSDFKVYGWGCNKFGQLSNNVQGVLQELPKLLEFGGEGVSQISCGFKHTVLLDTTKKKLITFGFNRYGQLGNGNTTDQSQPVIIPIEPILNDGDCSVIVKEIQCGWSNSCFLTNQGKLYLCGRGEYGILGDERDLTVDLSVQNIFKVLKSKPFNSEPISSFSMGSEHVLIQLENNDIYSVGWNEHYQLGLCEVVIPGKDGDNKSIPQLLPSIKGSGDYSFVKTGSGHSFFIVNK